MAPFFSVVIPTFRRPELLKACIGSVLRQRFDSFEVVVTDDERNHGESWSVLEQASRTDPRVRPIRNEGAHGQVPNTNNGVRHARGEWIKLLHDDDELHPDCLGRFHEVLANDRCRSTVSLACCRADRVLTDGRRLPWRRPRSRHDVEIVDAALTPLAMYLQQDIGSSAPTCICINRSIVERHGAYMPMHDAFVSAVDTLWALHLAALGDRVIINESLAIKRDEPISLTGGMTDEAMDREFAALRRLQLEMVPAALHPPRYEVALGALRIRRAMHRLTKRRSLGQALKLVGESPDPRAWMLALRMSLGVAMPSGYRRRMVQ